MAMPDVVKTVVSLKTTLRRFAQVLKVFGPSKAVGLLLVLFDHILAQLTQLRNSRFDF